jgi:hypothetical protein
MSTKENNYSEGFSRMSDSLDCFVKEVKNKKYSLMATDKWTVKEVLCHIVFWHSNYAANYKALVLKKEPPLLDGPGYKLNEDGVKCLSRYSVASLIKKLYSDQASLYQSIVIHKIPKMTYKKSTNRVYTTHEFLHLIERHFLTHAKQVKRAREVNR